MVVNLKSRDLILVSGKDSLTFLQSQFSNDISRIVDNQIQINCYCQHQGKVLAIVWVIKIDGLFYLSIPSELSDLVLEKLNLYKLMSDVDFEDVTGKIYQYGLIDETKGMKLYKNLNLLISQEQLSDYDCSYWEEQCVLNKIPEIAFSASQKFIPQALNLDVDELGVSFTKGCYPGQEVVARMHYLGRPKRRLFRFTSKFEVCIGDYLNVNNSTSLKSSGQIIRVAKKDAEFQFLGVFEVSHINDYIFLNNDQTKSVTIIHE